MLIEYAVLLNLAVAIRAEMEGFVVGGRFANILQFPHSAFLKVACVSTEQTTRRWMCGASVLNQMILLTAGHCVHSCSTGTHIAAIIGDHNRQRGVMRSANSFLLHQKYDEFTTNFDIALLKLYQPLKFNSKISRVVLMNRPPYGEVAQIAGWGLIDEQTQITSIKLKQVNQKVWTRVEYINMFGSVHRGTICASNRRTGAYPARGDSGSALVVRGYIQIGLVSYKVPNIAPDIIIYTDVGYYYNWINLNAVRLFCLSPN